MTSLSHNCIIEGKKILLRPICLNDVNEEYLKWLNDPQINEGLATRNMTMQALIEYVQNKIHTPHCYFFAIIDKQTNKHIGNIKLDYYDAASQVIELGLLIGDKNYWGKGIGYEACLMLIDYAFSHWPIQKIWLAVYANNPAAIQLYQKLGFKIEGIQKKHVFSKNELTDKILMAIFKEEWKTKI